MFDLQKDPEELRSVFGQKEYAGEQKQLESELSRLRVELKDTNADTPLMMGEGGTNHDYANGEARARTVKAMPSTNHNR